MKRTRLGDDAHVLRQTRERFADRRAELVDRHDLVVVRHRKTAADVEHVERRQAGEQRLGHQIRARTNRFDILGRIARLRAHVEGQAAHADAEAARELDQPEHGARLAAELLRQIDDCVRATEGNAQQELGTLAIAHELLDLVGVVRDERRHAVAQRIADVAVALDRVRVNAALGRNALRLDELHLARGRKIEEGAFVAQRRDDRSVRQRLQRVMQIDARQRSLERMVLTAHLLAVENEERRAEARDQRTDFSFRESRRVEGLGGRDCLRMLSSAWQHLSGTSSQSCGHLTNQQERVTALSPSSGRAAPAAFAILWVLSYTGARNVAKMRGDARTQSHFCARRGPWALGLGHSWKRAPSSYNLQPRTEDAARQGGLASLGESGRAVKEGQLQRRMPSTEDTFDNKAHPARC